jgi:probable rRNA maturation factor
MIFLDPDLDADRSPSAKLKRSADSTLRAQPQSDRIPSARSLARFLHETQSAVKLRGQVSVLLTTDKAIRRLNRQYRRKNKATDVLSFPAYCPAGLKASEKIAGDLAISVDTARKQAASLGHALEIEIKVLMLHGVLHLAGYDHETDEGEMARREERLRTRLQLPHGLIERSVRA